MQCCSSLVVRGVALPLLLVVVLGPQSAAAAAGAERAGNRGRRMQQLEANSSAICIEVARGGQCDGASPALLSLCAGECGGNIPGAAAGSGGTGHQPPPPPASSQNAVGLSGYQTACPALLALPGGCGHDLSQHDRTLAPGTRVGTVCSSQCRGHTSSTCTEAVLDVSFLGVEEHAGLELHGDACIDEGGANFDGAGHVEIEMDPSAYDHSLFAVSFWLLKAVADVRLSDRDSQVGKKEMLYSHMPADADPQFRQHFFVEIFLTRDAWLDVWTLTVDLSGNNVHQFFISLHRDEMPQWTHLAVSVDGGLVQLFADDVEINRLRPSMVPFAQFSVFKFNLDPDDSHTGARGWGGDFTGWATQLSEVNLYDVDGNSVSGATVTNPPGDGMPYNEESQRAGLMPGWCKVNGGDGSHCVYLFNECTHTGQQGCGELPQNTVDGTSSKWFDATGGDLVFTFGSPVTVASYDWQTGNDALFRDPTKWTLEGSNDGQSFVIVDGTFEDQPFDPTMARGSWTGPFSLDTVSKRQPARGPNAILGVGLQPQSSVGGSAGTMTSLRGVVSMLQLFAMPLTTEVLHCIHDSGTALVNSGRLALNEPSPCRPKAISTMCTSAVSTFRPVDWGQMDDDVVVYDDGSCRYDEHPAMAGAEHGTVTVTDSWQTILLHGVYSHPLVFLGVLSRQSTAQAVVRLGNLREVQPGSGIFSFEARVEQRSCHFAQPPPASELVSYIAVEGGVSAGGWQAGAIRVQSQEWSRVSFLRPFLIEEGNSSAPIVISTVQNFESRLQFVSTRHYQVDRQLEAADAAVFFVQCQSEGVMCPDLHYFAEYFDNVDLVGNPVATQCTPQAPDIDYGSCCAGVPPPMAGMSLDNPLAFSARWSSRIEASGQQFVFETSASGSTRVIVDQTVMLDLWGEGGSAISRADVLTDGPHVISFEFRSGETMDASPTDSYVTFSWTSLGGDFPYSSTNVTLAADNLHVDIAWLATTAVRSGMTMGSTRFEAGFINVESTSEAAVEFGGEFKTLAATSPSFFASVFSLADTPHGHLRILEIDSGHASVVSEYDTCSYMVEYADTVVGWLVLATTSGSSLVKQLTYPADKEGLIEVAQALHLPSYLMWTNGTDPCRDRWTGETHSV